jgi:predicted N-acetyltransferase YhbS
LPDISDVSVGPVDPRRLGDLRRRVLRGGVRDATIDEPRDLDASTVHVGATAGEDVVACASFFLAPYGHEPAEAYQLRFMAVDAAWQGRGVGARVLAEGERRVAARGARTLWANARDTALGFYLSLGWSVVPGSEFVSAETRLPHTVIVKRLG